MNTLQFRGNTYDLKKLLAQAPFGRLQSVETARINDISAVSSYAVRVAVIVDGKFHLLTGTIDRARPMEQLTIISTFSLKKALIRAESYEERREVQLDDKHHRATTATPRGHYGSQDWRR